jgi:hypothetical protein
MTSMNRISSLKWLQLILLLALVIPVEYLNVSNPFWSRTTFDPPHQEDGGSRWSEPVSFDPTSDFRVN